MKFFEDAEYLFIGQLPIITTYFAPYSSKLIMQLGIPFLITVFLTQYFWKDRLTNIMGAFLDALQRLSILYLLDQLCKIPFPFFYEEMDHANFYWSLFYGIAKSIVLLLAYTACLVTLMLRKRTLVYVSKTVIHASVIYIGYVANVLFFNEYRKIASNKFTIDSVLRSTTHLMISVVIFDVYMKTCCVNMRPNRFIILVFLYCVSYLHFWVDFDVYADCVRFVPMMIAMSASGYTIAAWFVYLPDAWKYACARFNHLKNFFINFGLWFLVESEWGRLNLNNLFRVYYVLRIGQCGFTFIFTHADPTGRYFIPVGDTALGTVAHFTKYIAITGCETMIAVLGMTAFISNICGQIGAFFQHLLMTSDHDKEFGPVGGFLFCILALQTGLTGLEPEKRFVRLCRNLCLLSTALLHIIHSITHQTLMALSASHSPSRQKHLRAILVSAFVIALPSLLLWYLWTADSVFSTWMFAVSAFSLEVIVKTLVSLVVYFLFLYDSRRGVFWEQLDDYVYYIRAFGNTVEFIFGLSLFMNGAFILLFEAGGAIRAGMMCIHAYFNIWVEAKAGWVNFIKRRTAVQKIELLPDATKEQLGALNDVCPICQQEMHTAKITKCGHYFHAICLRKWLYLQDHCPMCHNILYKVPPRRTSVVPPPSTEQEVTTVLPSTEREVTTVPPSTEQEVTTVPPSTEHGITPISDNNSQAPGGSSMRVF